MSDIFSMLEQDHRKVKHILEQIRETGEGAKKTRARAFADLRRDLEIHTSFEEETFYPEARRATGMEEEVQHALEEHSEAKNMLAELARLDETSEEWMDTLEELASALEDHISDEEEELFPVAREHIDSEKAQEMGRSYAEMKRGRQKAAE